MKLFMVFSISLATGAQPKSASETEADTETEARPANAGEPTVQVPVQVQVGQTSPITVMASSGVRVGLTAPQAILADSDVAAYAQGLERAHAEYSADAGWGTPSVIICEIPPGMEIDGQRLIWQAEQVA